MLFLLGHSILVGDLRGASLLKLQNLQQKPIYHQLIMWNFLISIAHTTQKQFWLTHSDFKYWFMFLTTS